MAEENNNIEPQIEQVRYDDENIRHLSDMEHVRTRPGMYIGRLGDGSLPEDGIYVLLKEVEPACQRSRLRTRHPSG